MVIAVNSGFLMTADLSWLWDVRLTLEDPVVAAGRRGTDLAVRLGYDIEHTPGARHRGRHRLMPREAGGVVANYTAFLQLQRALARRG